MSEMSLIEPYLPANYFLPREVDSATASNFVSIPRFKQLDLAKHVIIDNAGGSNVYLIPIDLVIAKARCSPTHFS
jgi:hypothetical protein